MPKVLEWLNSNLYRLQIAQKKLTTHMNLSNSYFN